MMPMMGADLLALPHATEKESSRCRRRSSSCLSGASGSRSRMIELSLVLLACLAGPSRVEAAMDTCSADAPETCSGGVSRSMVLGYVTPWNGRGYDVAKEHRHKFTHISPVWFQLKVENEAPTLTGGHDVDAEWMGALRAKPAKGNSAPRIVPRVVVEMLPHQYTEMLTSLKADVIKVLVEECKRNKLDGMVLEVWSFWNALDLVKQKFDTVKGFVQDLSTALHEQDGYDGGPMELMLTVPPPVPAKNVSEAPISQAHFTELEHIVDGFSLMTYDYNAFGLPGPNAPLAWVGNNLQTLKLADENKGKLLLGLNFYGREFTEKGVRDVLGHDYDALRAREGTMEHWDDEYQEHVLTYKEGDMMCILFYPTTRSLKVRMDIAKLTGAGISIWEIGQGLDEFMDVLA